MSDNDAELDNEMSNSKFEGDTENDAATYRAPAEESLAPAWIFESNPLPRGQDLENYWRSVKDLLGEDLVVEEESGLRFGPYPYPKGSTVPKDDHALSSHRHHEHGTQTGSSHRPPTSATKPRLHKWSMTMRFKGQSRKKRRKNPQDTLAGAAEIDYREVAPANTLQSQNIENALRATREAFFGYTGFQAQKTRRTESYMA